MPVNRHLTWLDIRDFAKSGGLWTRNTFNMPTDAAQQMDNYYPQPGGGLRAFLRPTEEDMTGLTVANYFPKALFAERDDDGIPVGDEGAIILLVQEQGTTTVRLFRKAIDNVGVAQWLDDSPGGAPITAARGMGSFEQYEISLGRRLIIAVGDGVTDEVLSYNRGAETAVGILNGDLVDAGFPMVVHQGRVVAADGNSRIRFTDPFSETEAVDSPIEVDATQRGVKITGMISFSPSDLLIARGDHQWALIQGDLADPIIRLQSHSPQANRDQQLLRALGGAVFMEHGGGIYLTNDGTQFDRIDPNLDPPLQWFPFNDANEMLGQPAVARNFLFFPRGLVFDTTTRSWFRVSDFANDAGTYLHFYVSARSLYNFGTSNFTEGRLYAVTSPATSGGNWQVYQLFVNEGNDDPASLRAADATWKSAPLRSPDGRQIEIREVQVIAKHVGGAGTNQITVTVGGTTITKTVPGPAGTTSVLPFLFKERGAHLAVTVRGQDLTITPIEAPTIEAVRVGTSLGHRFN